MLSQQIKRQLTKRCLLANLWQHSLCLLANQKCILQIHLSRMEQEVEFMVIIWSILFRWLWQMVN